MNTTEQRIFTSHRCAAGFSEGLPDEYAQDILHLLQSADAFACRAYDRQQSWISWQDRYCNRLEKYGCTRRSVIDSTPHFIRSLHELQALTLNVIGMHDGGRLVDLSRECVQALAIGTVAGAFFSGRVAGGYSQNWQVTPCGQNDHGEVELLVLGVHMACNVESRSHGLWTADTREVVLRLKGGVYCFEPQRFEPWREEILSALTVARKQAFVRTLL